MVDTTMLPENTPLEFPQKDPGDVSSTKPTIETNSQIADSDNLLCGQLEEVENRYMVGFSHLLHYQERIRLVISGNYNMLKQSPSRGQRSKGIKVKHVLQICLLLAVCFWLIYQVKHSHDKKKEFDEHDAKISLNTRSGDEVIKFGRKDLNPLVEEGEQKIGKLDEEEVEEEAGGEEEENNKHEEEQQDEDNRTEEKEDDGGGGGDDEIDEQEQEKSDMDVDHEEDFIDDEKEREEGDEKESKERDAEDNDGQMEKESSSEDRDRDGGARNTHEAREEQYKADDASSAVTHDMQVGSTEDINGVMENTDENAEVNILEQGNEVNNTGEISVGENYSGVNVEEGEAVGNGSSSTETVDEVKGSETDSQGSLVSKSSITTNFSQPELTNKSTEVSTEFPSLLKQNGTETTTDSSQPRNASEGGTTSAEGYNLQDSVSKQNNSTAASDSRESGSNSTVSVETENAGGSSNSSTSAEYVVSEKTIRSSASSEAEDSSDSSTTVANSDAIPAEKLETSKGTDETDGSAASKSENPDEVQHDPIDSSDTSVALEEKEVSIDLDTLPDIRTEGSNSEDAAAE
ncbi:hypothetical protein RJ639_011250 [Escallonia herrerae]|uniref:Uncharacterized protein n=1 Tax=Escallonia herrerae TaxID=1293975 RepID=A0AA88VPM3_9ASTE|nr:hypothetical protein RJ639_011250 [Escallonia herrerae]